MQVDARGLLTARGLALVADPDMLRLSGFGTAGLAPVIAAQGDQR